MGHGYITQCFNAEQQTWVFQDLLPFWPKGSLRWSIALSMGPLPVTQAWTAKPSTASMPSLALRTCIAPRRDLNAGACTSRCNHASLGSYNTISSRCTGHQTCNLPVLLDRAYTATCSCAVLHSKTHSKMHQDAQQNAQQDCTRLSCCRCGSNSCPCRLPTCSSNCKCNEISALHAHEVC